uniref:Uncharacterized protein n=1 Tax=viral metagenome TaxID=1070528 RepID=A0A6C0D7K7_9ZZZZ
MNNTIYLLLFLIIISISVFIFYNYREKTIEKFQTVTNNYIESDTFPNVPTPSNYIEIEYYSTIRGIQNEFITLISDYRNFRGEIDRFNTSNNRGYNYRSGGNTIYDIKQVVYLTGGSKRYRSTDVTTYEQDGSKGYALVYSGGYIGAGRYPKSPYDNFTVYNLRSGGEMDPVLPASVTLNEIPTYDNFQTNYNKFKNYVSGNIDHNMKQFLYALRMDSINKLKSKLLLQDKSLYNLKDYTRKSFWKPTAESTYNVITRDQASQHLEEESSPSGCYYNIGEFLGVFPSRDTDINRASNEKLRIRIYGSINPVQEKDFKESAFLGSLFNFNNLNIIDLYLRISYSSSNLNGLDLQYSHGLFSNDVKPLNVTQTYLYEADTDAINHNNTIFNYLTTNTLTFPPSSAKYYIEGNPVGVTCNLDSLSLKQQFVGTMNPTFVSIMPVSLRKYITSWSYNRTLRILEKRFTDLGDNNKKFYFLMGLALNNYFYSKNIKDSTGMNNWKSLLSQYGLNSPDTSFGRETIGGIAGSYLMGDQNNSYSTDMAYGIINAYFNSNAAAMTYRINDGYWLLHTSNYTTNTIYNDNNHKYRTINSHGTLPTITTELISELYRYYTSYIQKLVPDYGTPLNVLDEKILDSIAQHFYEISEGLYEITYIYDVYRVGSNMIDIRFDKKQRLDNIRYLNVRNQYIPQLNEYNRLLNIYDDGTWTNTYSNIDDYNNTLSTSIANLEPVFNPVYPIGGKYNYIYLKNLQTTNNTTMLILSNRLNTTSETVKSQLGSTGNLSNVLSQITPTPGATNDIINVYKRYQNTTNDQDITVYQNQYNSTLNAAYELSNMINGIESSVARIFITLDNSNFSINAIALGINAALSYNTLYNGNIDTPLTGEGNANYTPTIRYTKNIRPPVQCGNIEFMKTAANLYRDNIFTDISNVVLSNIPYDSNDGVVVVDKVLGFSQINDTTCGYTWVETQYDDLTNKPVKRNTVNIQIPFIYDDSEYQNSRLTFCNDRTLMKYSSNTYPFGNLARWVDRWIVDTRISLQDDISNIRSKIQNIDIELSNVAGKSNEIYNFSNTDGWAMYSNITTLRINTGDVSRYYVWGGAASNYKIRGVNINTFITSNFSSKTYFQLYDANQDWFWFGTKQNGAYSNYLEKTDSVIGKLWDFRTEFTNTISYGNLRLDVPGILTLFQDPYSKYYDAVYPDTSQGRRDLNPYVWGIILDIIDDNEITKFVEDARRAYATKLAEKNEMLDSLTKFTNELNNIDSTAEQMRNSIYINPTIMNYIQNNFVTIPRYLSDANNKLNDADGACKVLRCDDPTVMTQIMEQYNTDSNNREKILNILNAYTVNPYQCDYKVTTLVTASNIASNIILRSQIQSNISLLNSQLSPINSNYNLLNNQLTTLNNSYRTIDNQITIINNQITNEINAIPQIVTARNEVDNALSQLDTPRSNVVTYINNYLDATSISVINDAFTSSYGTSPFSSYSSRRLYDIFTGDIPSLWANNFFSRHSAIVNYINEFDDNEYSIYNTLIKIFTILSQNDPNDYMYGNRPLSPNQTLSFGIDGTTMNNYNIALSNYNNKVEIENSLVQSYTATYSNQALFNQREALLNQKAQLPLEIQNTTINISEVNRTKLDLTSQITNLQSQFNSLGITSNSVIEVNKSFDIGVDVRDCTYFYASVSNAGYFVSENQNSLKVQNNKSGTTGFYYTTATFNDFNLNVTTLINPLISEGEKQSSNMFNAVSNQRVDTYKALGELNTISFSNTPSLNASNILYMMQNNKRFFNGFFNCNYTENLYINNIKGFGITSSNTLQILIDCQTVTNNYPYPNTLGNITSACLEYGINVTPNYLDYTPYYIRNTTTTISKDDILNMMKTLPYYNNIPITLSNNIPMQNYLNFKRVLDNRQLYKGNCHDVSYMRQYALNMSNVSDIYIALSSAGYNSNDIERYAVDLPNYTVEFQLKSDENLPYNKRFFKIQVGYNDSFDANRYLNYGTYTRSNACFSYRFKYIESDPTSAIIPIIPNPYDQKLISLFHTYFNNTHRISSSNNYNSIIGQVYSIKSRNTCTLQYTASVYYTTITNQYVTTILPNDIYYNNLKAFEIVFFPNSSNNLYITSVQEVPAFDDGQNVNDFDKITNLPSPEYYGNLTRSICFPSISQTTFPNSFINYINTSNLTTYLKDTLVYDSNLSIFGPDGDVFSITVMPPGGEYYLRKMNRTEFNNVTYFQYKFDIINSVIDYNAYTYSIILKPSFRKYYKLNSIITEKFLNKSIIIFPPYSNMIDFITDEYYNRVTYPSFTAVNDCRILMQFTFYSGGKNAIDTCSRDVNSIMRDINIRNTVLFSNLNQSFTYESRNYTNFNNFLSYNNYNTTSNLFIEAPLPINQNIINMRGEGDNYALVSPEFLKESCGMNSGYFLNFYVNAYQKIRANVTNVLYSKFFDNTENILAVDYIVNVDGINSEVTLIFYDRNTDYNNLTSYPLQKAKIIFFRENITSLCPYINTVMSYRIIQRSVITGNVANFAQANNYQFIPDQLFITPFVDYKKPITTYDFIKFESKTPLSFNSINLYNKKKQEIQYKIKDKTANYIVLEVEQPIFGYSFVTNSSGTSPNSWIVKASDGKVWEDIDEQSYNLEDKKLYQTPIFYLDGSVASATQPQSFEKPEMDVEMFVKYYKQKVNPSCNPEFKKYMMNNSTYYFLFDDYDLNKNLVAKDLIIGFETSNNKPKKVLLYEDDDDGNYKPFDLRNSKQKEFWDSKIGLALEFIDF